jgi:diguanylate cyclase (GGDEF)-like protein
MDDKEAFPPAPCIMNQTPLADRIYEHIESEELKGFSRSIAELHWLLLILALLYFFIPTGPLDNSEGIIAAMVVYTTFILLFRYFGFQKRETRLRLAVETWAMTVFITVVLAHTGFTESPLLNLYLLVIIASAITLGKIMTLLEVLLIACCYLLLGFSHLSLEIFAPETFTALMAKFSPFLLVAYVTSMLAADIIAAKRRILQLSQTDELTGLLNMRAFNRLLDQELERARLDHTPFIVIMVDIDGLKDINDRHGHSAGTRLIRQVAETLKNSVRKTDIVARYGGDEFVILMHRASNDVAALCAERIRIAVNNTSFDAAGQRISTTASIGVAGFPDSVDEADKVLDKADLALYRSKQGGRNLVTWYDRALDSLPGSLGSLHRTARQYA